MSNPSLYFQPEAEYGFEVEYSVQQRDMGSGINDVNVFVFLVSEKVPGLGPTVYMIDDSNSKLNYPSTVGKFANTGYYCYNDDYQKFDYQQLSGTFLAPSFNTQNFFLALSAKNSDALANSVYFKNVVVCPIEVCDGNPQINYEIKNCQVSFTASSTSSSDDTPDFSWNFGDGTPLGYGTQIDHDFLWSGQQLICLSMDCGGKEVTTCINILLMEDNQCGNCTPMSSTEEMISCGENRYLVSGQVQIPNDYIPCNELNQIFSSQSAFISTSSIEIIGNNLSYSLEVMPYDPNGDVDISAHLVLCDSNGDPHCFEFSNAFHPLKCDDCQKSGITSIASCDTTRSSPDHNFYSGSFTLTAQPGYILCGYSSSIAGLDLTSTGNLYTYDLVTSKTGQIDEIIKLAFCRYGNNGELLSSYCTDVNIQVQNVCDKSSPHSRDSSFEKYLSDKPIINYFTQVSDDQLEVNYTIFSKDAKLMLYDFKGKLLSSTDLLLSSKDVFIYIGDLPPGMYLLQLVDRKGEMDVKKIVIF